MKLTDVEKLMFAFVANRTTFKYHFDEERDLWIITISNVDDEETTFEFDEYGNTV